MIVKNTETIFDISQDHQQTKDEKNRISLAQLPFFVPETTEEAVAELLTNGNSTMKWAQDGILGFHSIKFCSSNARQTAQYFELAFGFEPVAFRGLETGSRILASHVVRNGPVVFEIVNGLQEVPEEEDKRRALFAQLKHMSSAYKQASNANSAVAGAIAAQIARDMEDAQLVQRFVCAHGDGAWDVLLCVEDAWALFVRAVSGGAVALHPPELLLDEHGSVCVATVGVPGTDICHTLVQNIDYRGAYLPHFAPAPPAPATTLRAPSVRLNCVDHAVQNYSWNQMDTYSAFYARCFGFRKYWSVDEQAVLTGKTALRLVVMSSSNGRVKIPINEPALGTRRGQIEEFCDFFGGPGVQHIALRTRDILWAVGLLRERGVQFNDIGPEYYENLESRLQEDRIELFEDFEELRRNHILVDYDASSRYEVPGEKGPVGRCNYIAQIFTTPLHDRPTLFIEIIQRRHHNGFGKGTFKGLFESIERQQELRGTLTLVGEEEEEGEEEGEEEREGREREHKTEETACECLEGGKCTRKKQVRW